MKKKLNFEYCECGCHGFELSVAGQYFWVFDDLKGSFHVHSGHSSCTKRLGSFKSWNAVHSYVRKQLKKAADELKEALED